MKFDEAALQEVRETRLLINKCDAWLFDTIRPFLGQRILELGCGLGNLIQHLLDRDLIVGIDVDQNSVDYVNATYSQKGSVSAFKYDASASNLLELKRHNFDTVVSLNVLEHIEDDWTTFQHIHDVLSPGGRLVLIVPAHMFLYGDMDRSIGHYRRYTLLDLQTKLKAAGLRVEQQRYINPIGALGWFVNGRLLRRKVPPVGQLKLFNTLMPLVIAAEQIARVPFGLSVLSVSVRSSEA